MTILEKFLSNRKRYDFEHMKSYLTNVISINLEATNGSCQFEIHLFLSTLPASESTGTKINRIVRIYIPNYRDFKQDQVFEFLENQGLKKHSRYDNCISYTLDLKR